jgi:hypothetical protein
MYIKGDIFLKLVLLAKYNIDYLFMFKYTEYFYPALSFVSFHFDVKIKIIELIYL